MKSSSIHEGLKLAAFLEEGLSYVNQWTPTEINHGGCGVFAKVLSEHLTKKEIDHEIVVLYFSLDDEETKSGEKNLKDFIANRRNVDKAGEDHVCIKIDDLYYDSTGALNFSVLHAVEKITITKEVLDAIVEKGKWNPTFDRTCTEFIVKKMDEIFSKYEEFHSGLFTMPKDQEVELTKHTIEWKRKQNPFAMLGGLASILG